MVVEDKRVGVVVHHHDAMAACKIHQPLIGIHPRVAAGGHVGIVGPHQLHPAEVHRLQLVEVGLPPVVLTQVVVHYPRAENLAERGVGGIAGIGHEHTVAGVDEGEGDMEDALLAANEWQHLFGRVECHAIPPLIEIGHGTAQFRCSHRGLVAMGVGAPCHLAERRDGFLRRRHVGTSYGEADDVAPLGIEACHLLEFTAEVVFLHQTESVGGLYANWSVFHSGILLKFSVLWSVG